MELLAELSQENLIQLLHEIKGRKVPDVLVARVCGVCPQVIPRWREGSNLPRDFDRIYLTLRGLSAVAQGYRLTGPAATVEALIDVLEPRQSNQQQEQSAQQQEVQEPWKWWREHYERQRERNAAAAAAAGQQPTG